MSYSLLIVWLIVVVIVFQVAILTRQYLNTALIKTLQAFGFKPKPKELSDDLKGMAVDFIKEIAIIITDANGRIKMFNVGAELMFEFQEKEVLGSNISNVIIPENDRAKHISEMAEMMALGKDEQLKKTVYEVEAETKSGKLKPICLTLCMTKHQEGHQLETYYTAIIEDVTQKKKKQKEFESLLNLYRRGEFILNMGTWDWDLFKDIVKTTENFDEIFEWRGYPVEARSFMARVDIVDVEMVWATLEKAKEDGLPYNINFSVNGRNNKSVFLNCIGVPEKSENDVVVSIKGIIQIIDEAILNNSRV